MTNYDFNAKAKEIDTFLTSNNITIAKKSDLRAMFNIPHDNASAVWSSLLALGYSLSWSSIEKIAKE
jgi:hypothetical protein